MKHTIHITKRWSFLGEHQTFCGLRVPAPILIASPFTMKEEVGYFLPEGPGVASDVASPYRAGLQVGSDEEICKACETKVLFLTLSWLGV